MGKNDKTTILDCDVLNQATKGYAPLTDNEIQASCKTCSGPLSLGSCNIEQALETTYRCSKCDDVLVIIGQPNPDGKPWPGRGYRLNDFTVRNAVDLRVRGVFLPESPNALAESRD